MIMIVLPPITASVVSSFHCSNYLLLIVSVWWVSVLIFFRGADPAAVEAATANRRAAAARARAFKATQTELMGYYRAKLEEAGAAAGE